MKTIKIFHGSEFKIEKPRFNFGKKNNDYGLGFYCTLDISLAKEWATRYVNLGFANEYLLDISNLKILDLTDKKYNVLNWIALLLKNRDFGNGFLRMNKDRIDYINNYYIDIEDYDVIIGYRADDAYFRFPVDFIKGNVTLEQLSHIFELGYLGKQIVLKSKKAFENIKFIKAHETTIDNKNSYRNRIDASISQYSSITERKEDGTYIYNLMEKKDVKKRKLK